MSIKHFNKYLKQVEEQYLEMKSDLEELQSLCGEKAVDPDVIDNYKITLQPIRDAFLMLCLVDYLLKLPNRDKKAKKARKPTMEATLENSLSSCVETNKKLKEIRENA